MKIQRHVPPPPFGDSRHPTSARPGLTRDYLSGVTQSELVLAHPPLETSQADAHVELETVQVTIESLIAIGGARGAQVVACTVVTDNQGKKPFKAVAKIYDALYYSFCTSVGSFPVDSIWQADADYSREAAAYAHLDKAGQTGNFSPLYFGSWTFDFRIFPLLDYPLMMALVIPELASNPMLYFWRSYFDGLGGWVPHEWYNDPRKKQAWLKQKFGDDKHAGLYAAMTGALEYTDRPAY